MWVLVWVWVWVNAAEPALLHLVGRGLRNEYYTYQLVGARQIASDEDEAVETAEQPLSNQLTHGYNCSPLRCFWRAARGPLCSRAQLPLSAHHSGASVHLINFPVVQVENRAVTEEAPGTGPLGGPGYFCAGRARALPLVPVSAGERVSGYDGGVRGSPGASECGGSYRV